MANSTTPVELSPSPKLLVDGDIIAYRCAAVAEKTKYCVTVGHDAQFFNTAKEADNYASLPHGDYVFTWSRKELEPVENALNIANSVLEAIQKRFPQGTLKVFISGERNFRDTYWTVKKYKGNRSTPKPTHLENVRQHLVSRWSAVVSQNQEADDDIGIASRLGETIVVSTDKDLDQIEGWHYNWVKEEVYYVDPKDAEQFMWEQVISGDAVDNIPGLPGYGPVKARKHCDAKPEDVSWHDHVERLFRYEGFDYPYFHEMVTLVKILREPR